MNRITCHEASVISGISSRRIQQMCKNGEIEGVEKVGKSWLIPSTYFEKFNENKNKRIIKALPIGISDYKETVLKYYYVDKTLIIKDLLDNIPKVSLFTRPRRFGKTLTMDMLRVYFEKTDEDTSIYFQDKKIWNCGEKYKEYQGKYPVIFLTFKDVKFSSWQETLEKIKELLSSEFLRHRNILGLDLQDVEKEYFDKITHKTASIVELTSSIFTLSRLLYNYYEKPTIIIIDEYDTPIQQGYLMGFYDQIISFMRNLFSNALKDNQYLEFGFMTGILRVAKESIFSGLNNVKINSILDENYSQYFGFTKEEVKEMLHYYGVSKKLNQVCEWYDGYKFGNNEIFNPWSVINYIDNNCFPKAFWQSTGSNDIIGELVSKASFEIIDNLYKLLTGDKVTVYIDTNIVYSEIYKNSYSIYSFLLLAGYLKVKKIYPQNDGNFICDIAIPNKEIAYVYGKEILDKFGKYYISIEFQQSIFEHNVNRLQKCLESFLIESVSCYDGTNESFYHGMMLGLCAIVGSRYRIKSNRESGFGRFDIQLSPNSKSDPAFIFELKYVKDEKQLPSLALKALEQIDNKRYDVEMSADGFKNIVKVGIAFCGKKTSIVSK